MRKNNIYNQIQKRFQTSMIGSLARIEDKFGFLWGHPKEELNDREFENREIWEDLRTEILNHCNYQMREALEDLRDYMENDSNYQYNFLIKKSQRGDR